MKRSLKPTDLRDMTLGQLQVIVNDLHSQIESKWPQTPPPTHIYTIRAMSKMGKHMHMHTDPSLFWVDVKLL